MLQDRLDQALKELADLKADYVELQQLCKEIWDEGVEKDKQLLTLKKLAKAYMHDTRNMEIRKKLKQAIEEE
jgi:hypothetical protein